MVQSPTAFELRSFFVRIIFCLRGLSALITYNYQLCLVLNACNYYMHLHRPYTNILKSPAALHYTSLFLGFTAVILIVAELNAKVTELFFKIAALIIRLATLFLEIAELFFKIAKLTMRLAALLLEVAKLNREVAKLFVKIAGLIMRLADLFFEIAELNVELTELTT